MYTKVPHIGGMSKSGKADGSIAQARFDTPSDVATDDKGVLYIADTNNHRIAALRSGTVFTLNIRGDCAPLKSPKGVAWSKSFLYVVDAPGNSKALCKIDLRGAAPHPSQRIPFPGTGLSVSVKGESVVVADTGEIYVYASIANHFRLLILDALGKQIKASRSGLDFMEGTLSKAAFHNVSDMALFGPHRVLIADRVNRRIRVLYRK